MARIHLKQIDQDYQFVTTDEAGQQITMDIPVDQGGHGSGVRPMQALLSALGGCSAVDIVMILKKQKETIAKEFSDTLLRVAGKPKEYTYFVIDEVSGENWAQGDKFFA